MSDDIAPEISRRNFLGGAGTAVAGTDQQDAAVR